MYTCRFRPNTTNGTSHCRVPFRRELSMHALGCSPTPQQLTPHQLTPREGSAIEAQSSTPSIVTCGTPGPVLRQSHLCTVLNIIAGNAQERSPSYTHSLSSVTQHSLREHHERSPPSSGRRRCESWSRLTCMYLDPLPLHRHLAGIKTIRADED